MMLTLRKAQEKDGPFVYNLTKENMFDYFNKFLPEKWSDKKFWKNLNLDRILILESGIVPVGFLDLDVKEDFLYVHNIQVDAQYRGNGILLKKIVEQEAIKRKLNKIKGKVFTENSRALKLFQYLGYSIIEDSALNLESSVWAEKIFGQNL